MQVDLWQLGKRGLLSRTAFPILSGGKHATGKSNMSLPNNIGQRPPPVLEVWDMCTNILTKLPLSPTKISRRLRQGEESRCPAARATGRQRNRVGRQCRGEVDFKLELTCWLLRHLAAVVFPSLSTCIIGQPICALYCRTTLRVSGWVAGRRNICNMPPTTRTTVWGSVTWSPSNLIIDHWIKLSGYIEAPSENTGNENKLCEAGYTRESYLIMTQNLTWHFR